MNEYEKFGNNARSFKYKQPNLKKRTSGWKI
jgi:hypothetical protein